jgi:ribokinase
MGLKTAGKMKVAIIGDLAVDNVCYQDMTIEKGGNYLLRNILYYPGGVAGNISFYLKQYGIEPLIFSAVGDDREGKFLIDDLKRSKISIDNVKILAGKTGFLIIIVDSNGERTMIGTRGVADSCIISSRELASSHPSWIHVSGYSLLGKYGSTIWKSAVSSSKRLGIPLSLGLEGLHETKIDNLNYASIIFCNRMEFDRFFGESFDEVADKIGSRIVVKAGAEGCYILNGNVKKVEGVKVKKVVDTTGAGDAFDSAVIALLLSKRSLLDACRIANLFAAEKVKKKGAKASFNSTLLNKYFKYAE